MTILINSLNSDLSLVHLAVCKRQPCFSEVLLHEDVKERIRLWPQIEQARQEGKKAFSEVLMDTLMDAGLMSIR